MSSPTPAPAVTPADGVTDRSTAPPPARDQTLLEPRAGGRVEHIAPRLGKAPVPAPVVGTYVLGWVILASVFTAIGLLLTEVVLAGARGDWDESINRWLVEQRTAWMDRVTGGATFMANTLSVVVIAGVSCLVLVLVRRWRAAVFLVGALVLEVTVFVTVTALAERSRPDVPRMDATPPTGSFPSGHVGASVALWVGLALIGTTFFRSRAARFVMGAVAVSIALVVAFARTYRGMHHVTDVAAGVALGSAALVTSVIAVRLMSALMAARRDHPVSPYDRAVHPPEPEAIS